MAIEIERHGADPSDPGIKIKQEAKRAKNGDSFSVAEIEKKGGDKGKNPKNVAGNKNAFAMTAAAAAHAPSAPLLPMLLSLLLPMLLFLLMLLLVLLHLFPQLVPILSSLLLADAALQCSPR